MSAIKSTPSVGLGKSAFARKLTIIAGTGLILSIIAALLYFQLHRGNGSRLLGNIGASFSAKAETDQSAVTVVGRGDISKNLVLNGELRAVRSQSIYAGTSDETKITYLPPEGTIIKPGERLVELDSATTVSKIKDTDEKIVAAENEIVKTQSTNESTLRDMGVQLSRLWLPYEQAKAKARIPPGIETPRQYQEKQSDLAKAKAEYETQLAKIEDKKKEQEAELRVKVIDKQKLEVQLSHAKADLTSMNIKAPAEGMVIYADHWAERRKIQVGDVVWGGFSIVTLPDLKEMEVLAKVNEVDGPKLSVGQVVTVILDSYPAINITGKVREISQTAVKANWMGKSRIFNVMISLDKTVTDIMKPGMSAQVTVAVANYPGKLLVPRTLVQFDGGTPQVTRLEEGDKRRPIAVTILAADPFHYAVADNGALKEGDRIVK